MAKLISKVYADALFELAVENNNIDNIALEIANVKSAIDENEELIKVLNHPKIIKEEKIALVNNIFKGRVSDEVAGFIVSIVDKDRYNYFDEIFEYFLGLVKEYKGIGVAYVTSAIELSDAQKKSITEKLIQTTRYKEFEINYSVDKKLIGGLVIRIGDRVVDSSIKTKIEQMSRELNSLQIV
ncbi:MAG: F0F1 ATP synthase subunit delta [Lachnospiraceae bacterium]|nr:F0F1 ATP synthase subunit delta [Lachnospiraceae bacterium]